MLRRRSRFHVSKCKFPACNQTLAGFCSSRMEFNNLHIETFPWVFSWTHDCISHRLSFNCVIKTNQFLPLSTQLEIRSTCRIISIFNSISIHIEKDFCPQDDDSILGNVYCLSAFVGGRKSSFSHWLPTKEPTIDSNQSWWRNAHVSLYSTEMLNTRRWITCRGNLMLEWLVKLLATQFCALISLQVSGVGQLEPNICKRLNI